MPHSLHCIRAGCRSTCRYWSNKTRREKLAKKIFYRSFRGPEDLVQTRVSCTNTHCAHLSKTSDTLKSMVVFVNSTPATRGEHSHSLPCGQPHLNQRGSGKVRSLHMRSMVSTIPHEMPQVDRRNLYLSRFIHTTVLTTDKIFPARE